MGILAILKNIGFLISAARVIEQVVSESVQGKKFPECSQSSQVLDLVAEALRRKVIDIPGVDEDAVAAWIEKTKGEVLVCQAPIKVN